MDPFLRGFCEHYIDAHLEETEIQNIKGIIDIFGLSIKSKLDANLGFFLGYSYAQLLMQFLLLNNRLSNKDETIQFFNLMKRRFPEILREIKKTKKSEIKELDDKVTNITDIEVEPIQQTQE